MTESQRTQRAPGRRRPGFTLVELLVVIGIIALLIAILMPALTRARRQAQAVVCGAQLRGILQAMQMYVSENKQFIPGGPTTTGRFLYTPTWATNGAYNDANCPGIIQNWDWMSPLARYMQITFNEGPTIADRRKRFDTLRSHPAFVCPSVVADQVLSPGYPGEGGGGALPDPFTGYPVSYALAGQFLLMPSTTPGGTAGITKGSAALSAPSGYVPKITRVGDAARKVYLAEGCRYSTSAGDGPDVEFKYNAIGGGAFADRGPFSKETKAWDRAFAPGNGGGLRDARLFWARHGTVKPGGPGDAYKFQVGFFDGHVELMGDLQASDPNMWLPRGTSYDPAGQFGLYPDALNVFGSGVRTIL